MPKAYEIMRDRFYREFLANGKDKEQAMSMAKTKAAKIYNSQHKAKPVHPGMHD